MARRSTTFYATTILFLGAAGALVYGAGPGQWFEGQDEESIEGAEVRRGPLRITVVQHGNLSAKNSERLYNEMEGRTTILEMVEEGTYVTAGTVVAKLDDSEHRDARNGQEADVESAKAAVTTSNQNIEIQKSQNLSDIARAEQNLEFAEKDFEKYEKGEWPKDLQEADEAILIAEQQLAQDKNTLDWSTKLHDSGFLQRTRLEEDQLSWQQAKIRKEAAERDKQLLIDYDHPKQMRTLEAAVEEAKRELDRVELQAEAFMVDLNATLTNAKRRLELEEEQLAKINDMIAKAELVAPVDGMVVYGREESRWGQGDPIQKGTEVRERQEIVSIPQAGGMLVEASLHESVLKKVRVGQPCTIRVDALPGQEFQGTVDFIAQLPDSGSFWANPNQRLYSTEIMLDTGSSELRPGMSCEVEIVVAVLPDTLFVPVLAVHYDGGEPVVFVQGESEPRQVEIGQSSEKWAQVLDGVKEGEVVLLAPPTDFVPTPAPEKDVEFPEGSFPQTPGGEGQFGGQGQRGGFPGGDESGRGSGNIGGGSEGRGRPNGGESGRPGGRGDRGND